MAMLARRYGVSLECMSARYLDLGCAAGHTVLALAPLYPDVDFLGIDLNPDHIAAGRAEASSLGYDNVDFRQADFSHLPEALGRAHYTIVRGTYNWLAPEVKRALEQSLCRVCASNGVLKLHHIVRPGAMLREAWMGVLHAAMNASPSPAEGRTLLRQLVQEAQPLQKLSSAGQQVVQAMLADTDEGWSHDILNRQFSPDTSDAVFKRFAQHGINWLCSSNHSRNLPAILVSSSMVAHLATLPPPQAQTLLDHLIASGTRDDLFIRQPQIGSISAGYDSSSRYGVLPPLQDLKLPFQTVRGQVLFERQDCVEILQLLAKSPLLWSELLARLPSQSSDNIASWLDMLIAAGRVVPFLPSVHVARIDRERVRQVNRRRIQEGLQHLAPSLKIPLLAVEVGNCLEAGWFEVLALAHFEDRDRPQTQRRMLELMHAAGIRFRAPDGGADPNQFAALQRQLARLEQRHIARMPYWGIAV